MSDKQNRAVTCAAVVLSVAGAIYVIGAVYEPVVRPVLEVLLPFCVAAALALLLDPPIHHLQRRGLSRAAGVTIVAGAFLIVIALAGVFLVPVVVSEAIDLAANTPQYFDQAQLQFTKFMASHESALRRLNLPSTVQEVLNEVSGQAPAAASIFFRNLGQFLSGVASKAVWVVLIPIITIFLLADVSGLKQRALLLVPAPNRDRTADLATSMGHLFGAYIKGISMVAALFGVACGVAFWLWGVPYAAVLGVTAGLLSLVPYFGNLVTITIVSLVVIVHQASVGGNPWNALGVAITILVINQISDNLLSPRIVGRAVGIHPATAILALLIGGRLFGLAGIMLAVPIAASLRIVVLHLRPDLSPAEDEQPIRRPAIRRIAARLRRHPASKSPSRAPQDKH